MVGVAPGHFKYSFANSEAWRQFPGAYGVPAPLPNSAVDLYSFIFLDF